MHKPKSSDHVTWNTRNGETHGTVKKEITSDTQIKGQTIKADKDHPKILVESDKSGKQAAHKPEALRR